jgi:hypothetical protein
MDECVEEDLHSSRYRTHCLGDRSRRKKLRGV